MRLHIVRRVGGIGSDPHHGHAFLRAQGRATWAAHCQDGSHQPDDVRWAADGGLNNNSGSASASDAVQCASRWTFALSTEVIGAPSPPKKEERAGERRQRLLAISPLSVSLPTRSSRGESDKCSKRLL